MTEKNIDKQDKMYILAKKLLDIGNLSVIHKFIKLNEILNMKADDCYNIPNELLKTYEVVKSVLYKFNTNSDRVDLYFEKNVDEFEKVIEELSNDKTHGSSNRKFNFLEYVRTRITEDSKLTPESFDNVEEPTLTLFFGKDTFAKEYKLNFTEEGIIEQLTRFNRSR